jgi:hypothetical protein
MASNDDFLTTLKNIVTAVNSLSNTWQEVNGKTNSGEISTTTNLSAATSRIATVSVIVAGSTPGTVYDANSISNAVVGTRLFIIPNTVGVTFLNMPIVNGLVVSPGSGQIVTVSYS